MDLGDKANTPVKVTNRDPHAAHAWLFPASTTTYGAALRHYLDITSPPAREQIQIFVLPYARSDTARSLLNSLVTDKNAYAKTVVAKSLTVGNLLWTVREAEEAACVEAAEQLTLPFDALLSLCSRIAPRYYSISSSSSVNPDRPTVTAVILRYQAGGGSTRWCYGVATNYLHSITRYINNKDDSTINSATDNEGVVVNGALGNAEPITHVLYPTESSIIKVPVHVRHSSFRLPTNPTIPVVMIGPGTGIAPFRGFIQERVYQIASNKNGEASSVGATVLFFGSRHKATDFLYRDELVSQFETLKEANS